MSKHPPLCPKTPDAFMRCGDSKHVWMTEPALKSWDQPANRRLIARYQSCAWHDRAVRWDGVWQRGPAWLEIMSMDEMHRCLDVAKAWREWEVQT
jgi:hypothetical protein